MKKNIKAVQALFLAPAVFFIFPGAAFADAGTPLMWLEIAHLLVGNAMIGVLEGFVIARIFKVKALRSILIMVLANYASMIAGCAGVAAIVYFLKSFITLYSIGILLIFFLIISFLLSIVLEWPFCYWILKRQVDVKKKAWRASVIAQFFSYVIIVPLYIYSSGLSLLVDCKVDRRLSFVKSDAWVYYISVDGADVNRVHIDGSVREKVVSAGGIHGESARLFVRPSKTSDKWDLGVVDRQPDRVLFEKMLIVDFADHAEPFRRWDGELYEREPDSWGNIGISDFRPAEERGWKVSGGFWAIEGLHAKNEEEGKDFYAALETPFIQWVIRNITVLPGDQVVFSLGSSQIVVMDLKTRKIGLLAFGYGPVVIFNERDERK